MKWLDATTNSMDMSLSTLQEIVKDREAWHAVVHGVPKRHDLETEQQSVKGWQVLFPCSGKLGTVKWFYVRR